MSHLTTIYTYDYGKSEKQRKEIKQQICFEADEWSRYNSDTRSELPDSIKFESYKVFDSYDDAKEYLENHSGFYYQGAVLYKSFEKKANAKSERIEKKMKDVDDKILVLQIALSKYVAKNDVKNRKSLYIGCTKCGSKLNKNYIRLGPVSQWCPVCNENLFSETVKSRISKYQEDIEAQEKLYKSLIKERDKAKLVGKYELKWCVKLECHV